MNEENNNLNGTVLGSVDNVNATPNLESNNVNIAPNNEMPQAEAIDTLTSNNDGIKEGGQFFNAPNNPSPNNAPVNNFTNPETLGNSEPNLMPGFENPNQIGLTPPTYLDPNPTPSPVNEPPKQKKKQSNKILFIVIIILVLAAVGGGTYYVLRYTKLLNFNKNTINITPNNLEVNLGDDLPADNEFATVTGTNIDSCTIDKSNIDLTKEGTYNFTITCGNITKTGNVTIVDNSPIDVSLKDAYIVIGDTVDAKDFINDPNDDLTYEFTDENTVNDYLKEEGEYNVPIKVSASNKSKEVMGKLYVTRYKIKGYLICSTNPQNVSNSSATMTLSNKLSVVNNTTLGENAYGSLGFEIYTFTFTDESEYAGYLATYNSEGKVVINEVIGENVVFDDDKKTITITIKIDNTKLYTEYGESIFNKYTDMKNHFESDLGQTCIYQN